MKITNELRDYVKRRVDEIIPLPTSKAEADSVKDRCQELSDEFTKFMSEKEAEFIALISTEPDLEGVVFEGVSTHHSKYYLKCSWDNNPALQRYKQDSKLQIEFKQRVIEKIVALLSVQKEIDNLDAFIANAIETSTK